MLTGSGRPATKSPSVPLTDVAKRTPSSSTAGPRPHGRLNGVAAGVGGRSPASAGNVTSAKPAVASVRSPRRSRIRGSTDSTTMSTRSVTSGSKVPVPSTPRLTVRLPAGVTSSTTVGREPTGRPVNRTSTRSRRR